MRRTCRRREYKRTRSKRRKRPIRRICLLVECVQPSFSVTPVVQRYFYTAPRDIPLHEKEVVLYPGEFVDDRGEPAIRFPDFGQNGYFNLYVNGVLQEGQLYRVEPCALTIAATGQTIYRGTPIILESIGFFIVQNR